MALSSLAGPTTVNYHEKALETHGARHKRLQNTSTRAHEPLQRMPKSPTTSQPPTVIYTSQLCTMPSSEQRGHRRPSVFTCTVHGSPQSRTTRSFSGVPC